MRMRVYVLEYFSDIFLVQQHHLTASKVTCCQHEIPSFGSSSLRDHLFMRVSFLSAFARTRKKITRKIVSFLSSFFFLVVFFYRFLVVGAGSLLIGLNMYNVQCVYLKHFSSTDLNVSFIFRLAQKFSIYTIEPNCWRLLHVLPYTMESTKRKENIGQVMYDVEE